MLQTLEKEELRKVTGGKVELTYSYILTHRPFEGTVRDENYSDDSPPGPIYT